MSYLYKVKNMSIEEITPDENTSIEQIKIGLEILEAVVSKGN